MSVLVASYDGVMQFNKVTKLSPRSYAYLLSEWQQITDSHVKRGDLTRAKQAFEVAAAYGRLLLQGLGGL